MRFSRTSKAIGIAAIAALALTACGGGGGTTSTGSSASGNPNAIITAYGNEPQKPLMPADTNEVFGGRIVDMLFQGLRSYDANGKPVNELAESIDTSDSQNYTIKIKTGTKFTNGEAITAKTFVDSWNFAALSTNLQSNGSFFQSIEGYADVSATTGSGDSAKPAPKAQTMSGLKVVDDSTFTVKLSQPESDFPLRLGYSAFYPIPSAAIKDPKTYGQKPVGNGPYKMGTDGWQHDKSVSLVKNSDYTGPREAKNGGITFTFYTDPGPAYTDVQGGTLDVTDVIPSNALQTYTTDLPDHNLNKSYAGDSTLNIPVYLDAFKGEEGKLRRQAISMAIDREQITKVIFNGTRIPAKEFTAPVLDGFDANIAGSDVLKFDAAKAADLWAQADKIKPWDNSKPLTIAYNTDGGNKEWVDAVANQLKTNLKINAEGKAYPKFATMLDDRISKKLTGLVRAGWQADYPSLYNFLGPVLATGASSNYEGYSNPEFDKLLQEGLGAKTVEDGAKKFNEAQAILFQDLPNLPLWNNAVQVGWSTNVSNVDTDWRGVILYYNIVKS
ncbi:oligopeptide transport system substrate-binding protein [Psychromicrobium silvestre]|uniref:Oligopeptide transport system substrate-binding protein n=1 Tax=Psychromicrobium silvestre TaxID=1645614 RepID=A0A7Y9S6M2_9MICC|nr:ABC transporter substrate-binding protein [Psychromicrobium silvestre]NYE95090.1 oligopeptide transport system substrate-binding protein [Psychromicrobium silvestre]